MTIWTLIFIVFLICLLVGHSRQGEQLRQIKEILEDVQLTLTLLRRQQDQLQRTAALRRQQESPVIHETLAADITPDIAAEPEPAPPEPAPRPAFALEKAEQTAPSAAEEPLLPDTEPWREDELLPPLAEASMEPVMEAAAETEPLPEPEAATGVVGAVREPSLPATELQLEPEPEPEAVEAAGTAPRPAPEDEAPHRRSAFASAFGEIWSWIRVNPLFFGGLALLLAGVAFAVGYLVAHNHISPAMRLVLIGLGGAFMQGLGWRLKRKNRLFGLGLIGGGSVTLYFTLFAAFRLGLLGPWAALPLMVLLVLETCGLALLADAQILAAVAAAGAFPAPLLIDTGSDNFVALFGFYALLSCGAVCLSAFRRWDIPALLSCVAVYGIGGFWGGFHYRPDMLVPAEMYLVLFFLLFSAAHLLLARHADALADRSDDADEAGDKAANADAFQPARRFVHASLLFGVPILTFTYHYWLTRHLDLADSLGALLLAAFDLVLAWRLARQTGPALRLTRDALTVMGAGFTILAVPLALNATWTTCTWAIQGVACLWLGFRQERTPLRVLGYGMQVLAAGALLFQWRHALAVSRRACPAILDDYANQLCVMMQVDRRACLVMLALAALGVLVCCHRGRGILRDWEERLLVPWQLWAMGFWTWAGLDILSSPWDVASRGYANAALAFLAVSVGLWTLIGTRLRLPLFANSAAVLPLVWLASQWRSLPFLAGLPFLPLLEGEIIRTAPLAWTHGGLLALPLAWLVFGLCFRRAAWPETLKPRVGIVTLALLSAVGLCLVSIRAALPGGAFTPLLESALLTAFLAAFTKSARHPAFPFADDPERHDGPLCLLSNGLAVSLCLFSWFLLLCFRFDRGSLHLPLLSPLDMAQALCLAGAFLWFRGSDAMPDVLRDHLKHALGLAAFLFANVTAARSVAAWTGCAYEAQALLASPVFRVTLSVLWGGTALGCMITASHLRRSRRLWFVGLTLLLLTLGKLLFLDLADTETAYRSLSFVAVGLLMLGMGWFCPLPPKERED